MSRKTVKPHKFVQRPRPRDGGSYKRERDGSLTRIPDPVEEPAKGTAVALHEQPVAGVVKAANAPATVSPRVAAD